MPFDSKKGGDSEELQKKGRIQVHARKSQKHSNTQMDAIPIGSSRSSTTNSNSSLKIETISKQLSCQENGGMNMIDSIE